MVLNMPGIAGPVAWNGFARIVDIIFIDSECWLRVSLGVAHSVIRLFSHSKSAICQKTPVRFWQEILKINESLVVGPWMVLLISIAIP